MRFINRSHELDRLRALAAEPSNQMGLLYGRRRIGKTYLLTHAWDRAEAFYFTASGTTPEINRRALLHEASMWSGQDLRTEDYPTWRTAFRAVFELRPDAPIVVILDEFQYLASGSAGLIEVASELNAAWEGRLARTTPITVVLSGSAVGTLRELEAGGSPLYGRLDWRHQLHPFDYFDAGAMVSEWELRDRILAYAAFGGTPKYLDAIDTAASVDQNVIDLQLASDGKVRIQVETALEQEEGLRDVATYRAILAAVGLKRRSTGEIASKMGQSADKALKRMVKLLVELGYLEEEVNFEASRNQKKRYRLADPAQRLHYGVVLPNESGIANAGADEVWIERVRDDVWPTYVGFEVFEDVVGQAYRRFRADRGLPAVEHWGRWIGQDRDRRDTELDIVARTLDGSILSGSVKFRNQPAGATMLTDHLDALERLGASGQGWANDALADGAPMLMVSAAGFKESFVEVAEACDHQIIKWELADLW